MNFWKNITNKKTQHIMAGYCVALAGLCFSFLVSVGAMATSSPHITVPSPGTQAFLNQRPICKALFTQIAKYSFDSPQNGSDMQLGLTGSLSDLLALLRKVQHWSPDLEQMVQRRIILLYQNAASIGNPFLNGALKVLHEGLSREPWGGVHLLMCAGLNCNAKNSNGILTGTTFLNSVFRNLRTFNPNNDVSTLLPQIGIDIPHPNLGLSRMSLIGISLPNLQSETDVDLWLSLLIREAAVYSSMQVLSEWVSKMQFVKKRNPNLLPRLYRDYFGIQGRVHIVDPIIYYLLQEGSMLSSQIAALEALGRPTSRNTIKEYEVKAKQGLASMLDSSVKDLEDSIDPLFHTSMNGALLEQAKNLLTKLLAMNNKIEVNTFMSHKDGPDLGPVPVEVLVPDDPL